MHTMTYDEMRELQGGNAACTIALIGLGAAEIGLATAIFTGGFGLLVAGVGVAAALYGAMAGCSG